MCRKFEMKAGMVEHSNPVPVGTEWFYSDGRGPELIRAIWDSTDSTKIVAIDYRNPDDDASHLKHVRFLGSQIAMFTSEEVIGVAQRADSTRRSPAAAWDYGKSSWLRSFNQEHLSHCRHYQLFFYDQLLDVICENLRFQNGPYYPLDPDH